MKQEIITYLAGPRNFIQGVELYEKYGPDGGQNLHDSNVHRVLCGYGVGFCAGGISSGNVGSV